mmetsp:Transcript_17618/g.36046  ORF Transcript_17618/g.36046 Transcript_17618/m.36046 type:complete len:433 (+) Transcript_17618:252-1550(+)
MVPRGGVGRGGPLGGSGRRPSHLCLRAVHDVTDLVRQNQQACREQFKSNAENGGQIATLASQKRLLEELVLRNPAQLVHELPRCQRCWDPLGSLASKPRHDGGDGADVVNRSAQVEENVHDQERRHRAAKCRTFVRARHSAASTERDTPSDGSGSSVQERARAHDGAVPFELESAIADRKRDHKRGDCGDRIRDEQELVVSSKSYAQGTFRHVAVGTVHKVLDVSLAKGVEEVPAHDSEASTATVLTKHHEDRDGFGAGRGAAIALLALFFFLAVLFPVALWRQIGNHQTHQKEEEEDGCEAHESPQGIVGVWVTHQTNGRGNLKEHGEDLVDAEQDANHAVDELALPLSPRDDLPRATLRGGLDRRDSGILILLLGFVKLLPREQDSGPLSVHFCACKRERSGNTRDESIDDGARPLCRIAALEENHDEEG